MPGAGTGGPWSLWRSVSCLAIGGSYSTPGGNPFPADGIIPLLKPLADYSWVVGLIVSFVIYGLLARFTAPKPEPVLAGQAA